MGFAVIFVVLVLGVVLSSIRMLPEYQRGVIYTLGRFTAVKGPGLQTVIPVVQTMVRIDLRPLVMVVTEDVPTTDNLPLKLDAEVHYRIRSPEKAVNTVADYKASTAEAVKSAIRAASAGRSRDDILSHLESISAETLKPVQPKAETWGMSVSATLLRRSQDGKSFAEVPSA